MMPREEPLKEIDSMRVDNLVFLANAAGSDDLLRFLLLLLHCNIFY